MRGSYDNIPTATFELLTGDYKFSSFQLQDMDCFFLSLPPIVQTGSFVRQVIEGFGFRVEGCGVGFKSYSFQSQNKDALHYYYLSLPPIIRTGSLAHLLI